MSLGIPYMGSKRKMSKKIIDKILQDNPNCKYFYDLFGGGGAISFEALQRPQIEKVFYNELNTGVVELLKKIQKDGVTPDFYNWIDRETFNELKNGNDWKAGLVKTCWSFGNNQKHYLFGKAIEDLKKEAHYYLMNNGYDRTVKTRIPLMKEFKEKMKIEGSFRLEHLERLQNLENLEQLQQLEHLEQLEISNLSYEKVKIETPINETIIYLDPPYANTEKYQEDIEHDALYCYIMNSEYKIYMSSYESGLYEVDSYDHNCTLSATANNKVKEVLYCNYKT